MKHLDRETLHCDIRKNQSDGTSTCNGKYTYTTRTKDCVTAAPKPVTGRKTRSTLARLAQDEQLHDEHSAIGYIVAPRYSVVKLHFLHRRCASFVSVVCRRWNGKKRNGLTKTRLVSADRFGTSPK